MTTSQSPLSLLKSQAEKIAASLKALSRNQSNAVDRKSIKFAVVMDDKIVTIDMPWIVVRETSEAALAEYILRQMQGARDPAN